MSKHTPGPFEIRIAGKDPKPCVFTAASPSEPLGRAVARFERIEDAQAFVAHVNGRAGEQGANARLIAAAPDLLAALECIAAWGEGAKLTAGNVRMIRATIAKATGGDL